MIQRRKFDNIVYDLLDETKTLKEAEQKQKKFWKNWNTHYKITKSTHSDDPLPFKLWGHNDPKMVWDKLKPKVIHELDNDIKDLILELNAKGIYTIESCSGHRMEPGRLWLLKSTFDLSKFMAIMKKHGMSNIKRRGQPNDGEWRDHLYITFDLPGHTSYPKRQKPKKVIRKKPRNIIAQIWG
jgi:hypothetical protein